MPEKSIIPAAAYRDRRLKPNDVRLLLCLGEHINQRLGYCVIRQKTIASELGLSRRSVIRIIERLAGLGYVAIERRRGDGGADLAHAYRLTAPRAQEDLFETPSESGGGGDTRVTGGVTPESHRVRHYGVTPRTTLSERITSSDEEVIARARAGKAPGSHEKGDTKRGRRAERRAQPPRPPPGQRSLMLAVDGGRRQPAPHPGTRIPPDWSPSEIDRAFARDKALSPREVDREAQRFRDHYLAAPGERGVRADWSATWRKWVLGVLDRKEQAHGKRDDDRGRKPGDGPALSPLGQAFARLKDSSG